MKKRRGHDDSLPVVGSSDEDDKQRRRHALCAQTSTSAVGHRALFGGSLMLLTGGLSLMAWDVGREVVFNRELTVVREERPRPNKVIAIPERVEVGVIGSVQAAAEASHVREWLEYHYLIGVRRFDMVVADAASAEVAPLLEAYPATAHARSDLAALGAQDERAELELLYDTLAPVTDWLVLLRPNEFVVSPTRGGKTAGDATSFRERFSVNPLFEAIDPALRRETAEAASFAAALAESQPTAAVTTKSSRVAQWPPSIADALSAMDETNAVVAWAGVALPWVIFGDSGRRAPARDLGTVAAYTKRADPTNSRDWRARSYTAAVNCEACALLRADAKSAVHVCKRAHQGWPPYIRTAAGVELPTTRATLSDEAREGLERAGAPGRPKFPYAARYTRSATEWANSTHGAAPARELSRVPDGDVVRQLEARLHALHVALELVAPDDTWKHTFSDLVRLLLGPAHLARRRGLRVASPSDAGAGDKGIEKGAGHRAPAWLVDALDERRIRQRGQRDATSASACLACDLVRIAGDGWERALLYDPADAELVDDVAEFLEQNEHPAVAPPSKTKKKQQQRKDSSGSQDIVIHLNSAGSGGSKKKHKKSKTGKKKTTANAVANKIKSAGAHDDLLG